MEKITYLLGAGASINALPIVKEIPDKLEEIVKFLKFETILDNKDSDIIKNDLIQSFIKLKENIKKHTSIDTYAKKLSLYVDKNELREFKIILSVFFDILQNIKPIDPRYDTFLTSILDNSLELPNEIKILSWNYDSQFERAYNLYSNQNLSSNKKMLNMIIKNVNYNGLKKNIFKLNGTTSLRSINGLSDISFIENLNEVLEIQTLKTILRIYNQCKNDSNISPTFSFAWEEFSKNYNFDFIGETLKNTSETTILVIIGYSLPFYNRQIDKLILNNMSKLHKIYIQDPEATELKEKLENSFFDKNNSNTNNIPKIIPIKNTKEFHIPYEY